MNSNAPKDGPWGAIDGHQLARLDELFISEPDRLSRLSMEVGGLYFDWSKTHLDAGLIGDFEKLAEAKGFAAKREALFSGAIVNASEDRPATHVAERGQGAPEDVKIAGALHQRMRSLVDAIEGGAFGEVHGLLHIGIGGSALGPELLLDALGRDMVGAQPAFDEIPPVGILIRVFHRLDTVGEGESLAGGAIRAGRDQPDGRL